MSRAKQVFRAFAYFFPAEDTAKNERNNFPFKQKKTELIPSSEMTMVKDCSVYAAATA